MASVDLWECQRCWLKWVEDGLPDSCPRCRLQHSIPLAPIMVAGRNVREQVVRLYGLRTGLGAKEVRRLTAVVDLGLCPHGCLSKIICRECVTRKPFWLAA